jgi:hypothetical protein
LNRPPCRPSAKKSEVSCAHTPGMRRMRTGIDVGTYRPVNISPEFARMTV